MADSVGGNLKTLATKRIKVTEGSVLFHGTKQALLENMLMLLEDFNPDAITTERVLARGRVSSGSLYHHFDGLPDLLEQALCIKFEEFADRTIDLLLMTNEQAKSLKQWSEGVAAARKISHGPMYLRSRVLRVWAVAHATSSERMATRLGQAQDRLNKKFIEFIKGAQKAGWLAPDMDPLTLAVFVQAYQFGAVIDDVALEKVDGTKWIELLDRVIKKSFGKK